MVGKCRFWSALVSRRCLDAAAGTMVWNPAAFRFLVTMAVSLEPVRQGRLVKG